MTDNATPAPRWRRALKVALAITVAIMAAPFVIMMLLGTVDQGRR